MTNGRIKEIVTLQSTPEFQEFLEKEYVWDQLTIRGLTDDELQEYIEQCKLD